MSCGPGNVTLKNASVATFSYGPGVSIEAVVIARINGGDSPRIGRTVDGIVMMCFAFINAINPPNVSRNDCNNRSGAGCSLSRSVSTCTGVFVASTSFAIRMNSAWSVSYTHLDVYKRQSLRATLAPAQTDFMYFVANTQGGHFFSKTLAEHNRNVNRYRKLLSGDAASTPAASASSSKTPVHRGPS